MLTVYWKRDFFTQGDCLKLIHESGDFFATVTARLKKEDRTFKFQHILWEGIDYLTIKEFKKLLRTESFLGSMYLNSEEELCLKLVLSPPPLSDFFTEENIQKHPWIPGFRRMREYLANALEMSSNNSKDLHFSENEGHVPLSNLIHQTYKQKSVTTVIALLNDLPAQQRSYFLQKFALDTLNNYREGRFLVIYCPLSRLTSPTNLKIETLSLYGLNPHAYLLQKLPIIWVIDELEQFFDKHNLFNVLSGERYRFDLWNCHFLLSAADKPNPDRFYSGCFNPIQTIRVIGRREDEGPSIYRFFYSMTAEPIQNNMTSTAISGIPISIEELLVLSKEKTSATIPQQPHPTPPELQEPLDDPKAIEELSIIMQDTINAIERASLFCVGIQNVRKVSELRQSLNNAKSKSTGTLEEFLNHKEKEAKSILQAFAYYRVGLFGESRSVKRYHEHVEASSLAKIY
ncbi:hypothetical protein [Legionella sp. 16cNR16C]|uniref:hypothetical protein n=1 Tax=Legionella sp. 16cNR16C TaxID=2905656 RepID=UPI001E6238C0|nr:hypothetical protein [Legionella sp. 16cNR16C]MCE3043795.1 hypothetical protein [Legionella sp. 16cNR16C]